MSHHTETRHADAETLPVVKEGFTGWVYDAHDKHHTHHRVEHGHSCREAHAIPHNRRIFIPHEHNHDHEHDHFHICHHCQEHFHLKGGHK